MDIFPVLLLIFVVIFLVILLVYSIYVKLPLEFRYEDRPNLLFLYLRVLRICWKRRRAQATEDVANLALTQGRIEVIGKDCRLDPGALVSFKEVCGFPKGDTIPGPFVQLYFTHQFLVLITHDEFKLDPLGIIHVAQTMTQHTSLEHLHKEPCDMEMTLTQCKPTERGIQLQISLKVYDRREMCIFEALNTLLVKTGERRKCGSHKTTGDLQTDLIRKNEVFEEKMSANLGRRFARVSGDFNFQHLFGWTARLVGFKQPIAHGQWTVARCLAHLQSSGIFPVNPPFHINVEFKRPIYLPGTSVFTFIAQANKDIYRFEVEDKETKKTQLIGYIKRS